MKVNKLKYERIRNVCLSDLVVKADGTIDLHPDLTTHISGQQWMNVYDAVAFANRLGTVMNVHVTIAWRYLGIVDHTEVSHALVRWTERFRKWCDVRKLPCCYVYAHEVGPEHGLHTHVLTSVPRLEEITFGEWAWTCLAGMSSVEAPSRAALCVQHRRDADTDRQWLWFNYLMKGADYTERFQIDGRPFCFLGDLTRRHHQYGGLIRCSKRVGVSRNIDGAARRMFELSEFLPRGFRSDFDRGASTPAQLYHDGYYRAFLSDRRSAEMTAALSSLRI